MPVIMSKVNPVQDAWALLHQTYQSVAKCAEERLIRSGLSHQQYLVLKAIKEIPGTVTPSAVANWVDRNPNSITLIIDRMEKNGLVKRVRDLEDRRSIRLVVTPEGNRKFQQADKPASELPGEVFSCLTSEEVAVFTELITRIRLKTFEIRHIEDKVIDMSKVV